MAAARTPRNLIASVTMLIPRRPYYVYIVASISRTIYVGMTNDLARRMYEHRTKAEEGFAARYNVNRLVWYEVTGNVSAGDRTREADQGL